MRAPVDRRSGPAIGISCALLDYAQLSPALADEGRTSMLDERSAVAAARDASIDILVVAPRHDWWAERAVLAELEREARRSHVPVLAMVPLGDTAALAAAFDAGVTDCVAYPFDTAEVAVRVRALLRRKHADDRRRLDDAAVRRLAMTDSVTGLSNRHQFDAELAVRIAQAHSEAYPLSLLMIDIDGFKPINDRYGHAVGDKVLRQVATRLVGGIRSGDTLARFGGDELALIMPHTGLASAAAVGERLRALVADRTTELPVAVTISIGVAELAFDEPPLALVKRADAALYAAKLDGRNRVAAAS